MKPTSVHKHCGEDGQWYWNKVFRINVNEMGQLIGYKSQFKYYGSGGKWRKIIHIDEDRDVGYD